MENKLKFIKKQILINRYIPFSFQNIVWNSYLVHTIKVCTNRSTQQKPKVHILSAVPRKVQIKKHNIDKDRMQDVLMLYQHTPPVDKPWILGMKMPWQNIKALVAQWLLSASHCLIRWGSVRLRGVGQHRNTSACPCVWGQGQLWSPLSFSSAYHTSTYALLRFVTCLNCSITSWALFQCQSTKPKTCQRFFQIIRNRS